MRQRDVRRMERGIELRVDGRAAARLDEPRRGWRERHERGVRDDEDHRRDAAEPDVDVADRERPALDVGRDALLAREVWGFEPGCPQRL